MNSQLSCAKPQSSPGVSNQTKSNKENNQTPIERLLFESNIIEHLILCEFDYRTNRTNRTKSSAINQNRTHSNKIAIEPNPSILFGLRLLTTKTKYNTQK